MKYVIICGGDGTRWGNYNGVNKHFAIINNETILDRTIRLLKENGVTDITVASNDYNIDGVKNYHITHTPEFYDADKFLSSVELWNDDMVIIYGDVYFSEKAIQKIVNKSLNTRRPILFCNPRNNEITGTEWGECFAFFIPLEHIVLTISALNNLVYLFSNGKIWRTGGWELARLLMNAKNLNRHRKTSKLYCVISDETDDLDYPDDYERIRKVVES